MSTDNTDDLVAWDIRSRWAGSREAMRRHACAEVDASLAVVDRLVEVGDGSPWLGRVWKVEDVDGVRFASIVEVFADELREGER